MINFILNHLFPCRCPVCGQLPDRRKVYPFCSACWDKIHPYDGPCCDICAKPADSPQASLCSDCISKKPHYERVFFYGLFEGPLKEAIHLLKYRSLKRLAFALSDLLSDLSVPKSVEVLIPVPLHKRRLLHREFNQSALIGKIFAESLNIPFEPFVLRRASDNKPQSRMKKTERIKNVHNIFQVTGDVKDRNILLFDDVITTGATVDECARILKKHGAGNIYVAAIARAFLK